MNVFVTGAAGSLGRQLIKDLLQLDHHVFATDIKPNPFSSHEHLQYKTLDIRSDQFIDWFKECQCHVVIHLASVLQISKTLTREMAYEIDVVATKHLLKASAELGVDKFVITTSGAAYGYYPENNQGEITEKRVPKGNQDYFYSNHKAQVEKLMAEFRLSNPEMKQVVFRPGAIIGPGFEGPIVNLFEQKVITGLIGYPSPFNFIWSEDVVSYLIEAAMTDITGEYNIAGDGCLSMKQIAHKLGKFYLALPPMFIQAALFILKPLGLTQYGPEQVKFIKYRPVLSNKKLKSCFSHQPIYTSEQALSAYLKSEI